MKTLLRFGFLFIILIIFVQKGASQDTDSTYEKWNLVKSHIESDSYLQKMKSEQDRLASKLKDLRFRQSQLELDRDRNENISHDVMEEADKLQMESDFLNSEVKNLKKELLKLQNIVEKKYFKNLYGVVRYIGKSAIQGEDKIYANVCIINGNVVVDGHIKGDMAIINSDLFVSKRAKIDGKIVIINSSLYAEGDFDGNKISTGSIDRYDEPYNEYATEDIQYSFNFSPPQINLFGIESHSMPVLRYNRVEGLYLGTKTLKKYYWSGRHNHSIYGEAGYGFANHFWTGDINLDMWLGNYTRSELGGEGHVLVDSKDNWLIGQEENTFASFFIHEDFKDYFKKEGWSLHFSQYVEKNLRVRVDYISDKYKSMENNTDWSLFGKGKVFRVNPRIDEGNMRSTIFSLNYITVRGKDIFPTGWNLFGSYEISKGDFEFNRFILDLRRYQKLSDEIRMNGRIIVGSAEKNVPLQRSFDMGGLGSIPAVGFKEFRSGNRMLLANAELILKIPDGDDFLPFDIFNGNDVILFYDAGMLRYMHPETALFDGFENIKSDEIISDLGAALSFNRGSVRIGATFRLDKHEPAKFFFRLTQPF